MHIGNDLHIKLYAEDYIRAQLVEAENYRMLIRLRKHRQYRILRPLQLFLVRLGHTLISLGERLEGKEFSSAPIGEFRWIDFSISNSQGIQS
jgi:hypothetical protein